ncbi:MAG: asparagine synthase (glutamine-hydrolyzing) [Acidobacteria bacterium]|nr:asparagine synthase (glutamine-hydrolyzing) [Acidobacteriota bacterium]
MCGICGVFEFGKSGRVVEEDTLIRMRDTMTHRGPDDAGVYLSADRRVGLGHRRLSIVDLSPAGRQPMSNEDGTIWITFNGEIYNHAALRRDLEAKGHIYRSRTDTETLVHLYEEEGAGFVSLLEGMFALAIWDGRRQELLLVRDRIGVKPLYYTVLPGTILFASEIKAILEHPRMSRRIDLAAFYHYLTFIAAPSPRTLFQGVHKLPPSTIVTIDRRGAMRSGTFWDPMAAPAEEGALYDDAEFCAARVRDLLARAIEKRMMADVPFGVFLSGGLDSSANVALMARIMDRPVRTFSVGFKDHPAHNEFLYARKVATLFKTDHHEVEIGWRDLLDFMPELVFHQDEPIADWVCVPLHYVARLAKRSGTIVVQVGEGSDEQFFGYDHYLRMYRNQARFVRPLMKLPRALRLLTYHSARGLAFLLRRGGERLDLLRSVARDETFFWGGAIAWREEEKKRLLSGGVLRRLDGLSSHDVVLEFDRKARSRISDNDFGKRMIYLELKNRLAELLLMRVDKITMASSIEARVPFLDHALVEFTMRVPTELKIRSGQSKFLLKKAMAGILPDEIVHRPKRGFGAPVSEWLRGDLYAPAFAGVMKSRLREENLLDYGHVERLFRAHRAGARDHSWHLWTLYNLSGWYDHWIAREAA